MYEFILYNNNRVSIRVIARNLMHCYKLLNELDISSSITYSNIYSDIRMYGKCCIEFNEKKVVIRSMNYGKTQ